MSPRGHRWSRCQGRDSTDSGAAVEPMTSARLRHASVPSYCGKGSLFVALNQDRSPVRLNRFYLSGIISKNPGRPTLIRHLMDQGHRFVLSDCRDVVTTLKAAAFGPSLARLESEGLSPSFATELEIRLNTYEARYISRQDNEETHRAESEAAQEARAEAARLHAYLETKVRALLNRRDPVAQNLAQRLRYQRARFDSLIAAQENLHLVMLQLKNNPHMAKLQLRAGFQAECEEALKKMPAEHAEAVTARVSREVDTSQLRVENDTITQMMEELLILADAVFLTYGDELVGLDLALLRSRAAPKGDKAEEGGGSGDDGGGSGDGGAGFS